MNTLSDDPRARVSDLFVTFGRDGSAVQAVRGVSLDVRAAEILGVVGESGSGKTIFGLSLLGLLPRDPAPRVRGEANICGVDMISAPEEERRLIRRQYLGAVFQDPMSSLNPTKRVGVQVTEAAGSRDEALRLLQLVALPEAGKRLGAYPHELSGGQRQRVMMAMAVARTPKLIVADEPTTALDVTVQAQILCLISDLRNELGCSFILITHDLGIAAQIADRIAVFYGGRLMEVGTASEVLTKPAHPYTAGLLRSRLSMTVSRNSILTTLRGEPPDPRRPPTGCPFAPRCAYRIDACDWEPPSLQQTDPASSRSVACIRADEIEASRSESSKVVPFTSTMVLSHGPALRLRGVSKSFKVGGRLWGRERLQALLDIDLDVTAGQSLAVVGESGSGKSTLLRVVAGLIRPDRGVVENLAGGRPQMVFQDAGASLTPWLTVGELIGERLEREGITGTARARRVEDVLDVVGLSGEVSRFRAASLSGGQRQRVAIARAIVIPPPILLCDEPTSSLDASLAATVLNLLNRFRREFGFAMLFVTHDLTVARLVADRITVMYLGKVVEAGPVEKVLDRPAHPYTRALLAAVPDMDRAPVRIAGESASAINRPTGCPFHTRCPVVVDKCRVEMPQLEEHLLDQYASCWRPFIEEPGAISHRHLGDEASGDAWQDIEY